MHPEQRQTLLKIAREVIEATVRGQHCPPRHLADPIFNEKRGCFVTIKNRGSLRGCIGTFIADQPLLRTVEEMARSALQDPRFAFDRVRPGELSQLEIEISVLSPLQKTCDPLSLTLGKHGIYIRKGPYAGCFLPQVATEQGWTKEQFLTHCCSGKAGLEPDAWKKPGTEVLLFTAEVFSESKLDSQ